MSQKKLTKPNIEPLNDKQLTAVDLLISGWSVMATAAEIGVSRETVSRWKNNDVVFIAAYNQARLDAHEDYQTKLAELRTQALDYLLDCLDGHERIDRKTRVNIALKLVSLDTQRPALEVNPHLIESEIKRRTDKPSFEFDF